MWIYNRTHRKEVMWFLVHEHHLIRPIRQPNFRNLLVKASLPPTSVDSPQTRVPFGNFCCGHCAHCNFTQDSMTFNHPQSCHVYKIKSTITCDTSNVIYLLKRPCGLAYVGKTSKPLKIRSWEIYNQDVKSSVARHFTQASHSTASLYFSGTEALIANFRGGDKNTHLLRREAFWIY